MQFSPILLTFSSLLSHSHAAALSPRAGFSVGLEARATTYTGQATYYGGNVKGGACGFSTYTLPSNIYGTAISDTNWAGSAICGACVSVKGPNGNSITAMVSVYSLSSTFIFIRGRRSL